MTPRPFLLADRPMPQSDKSATLRGGEAYPTDCRVLSLAGTEVSAVQCPLHSRLDLIQLILSMVADSLWGNRERTDFEQHPIPRAEPTRECLPQASKFIPHMRFPCASPPKNPWSAHCCRRRPISRRPSCDTRLRPRTRTQCISALKLRQNSERMLI